MKPYFYLIQHVATKKLYAGSRWEKDCCVEELLKPGGYLTSSRVIKRIIEEEGIDAFVIIETIEFDTGEQALDYETKFLQKHKVRSNPEFINRHENDITGAYDSKAYKELMIKLYNVEHPSKSKELLEKKRLNFIKNHGVENPMQVEEFKTKAKLTNIEKYGADNTFKSKVIIDKIKDIMIDRYGVDNISKSEDIKQVKVDTCRKNYGVDNPSQSDKVKDKKKETYLKNYGVTNWAHSEEAKQKRIHKANRPIVQKLKKIQDERKIKLGSCWTMRSDEVLEAILKELER